MNNQTQKCLKCGGTGKKLIKAGYNHHVSNEKCLKCNGTGRFWVEEFEDEIALCYDYNYHEIALKKHDLEQLFEKYLDMVDCENKEDNWTKVKIKARKGIILIEKVEE